MYVNREAGILVLESPSVHEQQRRSSVRPGQGSGVAVVARSTASNEWRREPERGRRRPAAGVTTLKQQRPVQQEEAATRHDHSRRRYVNDVRTATPPSHSTPLDSTATRGQYDHSSVTLRLTLGTQRQHIRTAERQLVRLRNFNVRHSLSGTHSDNFNVDYYCGYFRSSPRNSSATRAQFQYYTVSR